MEKKLSPNIRLLLIIFLFFIIGIMLATITYLSWYIVEYREIPVTFRVVESGVGILKDDSQLNFGHITPGGSSQRWMNISVEKSLRLRIGFSENIDSYVLANYSDVLEPNQIYTINFSAHVPESLPLGEYNGAAKIYFLRK